MPNGGRNARAQDPSNRESPYSTVIDHWRSGQADVDEKRFAIALGLTHAQARIATKLARGASVTAIADAIHRSEATVRWHVRRLMVHFGCRRQSELVALLAHARAICSDATVSEDVRDAP